MKGTLKKGLGFTRLFFECPHVGFRSVLQSKRIGFLDI